MSRLRGLLLAATTVLLSVAGTIAALELTLRLFPVQDSPFTRPVTAADPVLRADPDTVFHYSRGWNFHDARTRRTNNDGFFNPQTYRAEGPRPLIAIIGDSYIEARMVDYAETVEGRLAAAMGRRGRVYSFALSGAPLSQYVAWARYARAAYRPDALAVFVVGNDFDESLYQRRLRDGFYHYRDDGKGGLVLRLSAFRPSWLRSLLLRSALARYLVFHLRVRETLARLTAAAGPRAQAAFASDPRADTERRRVADSLRVIGAVLRDLGPGAGLPPERVLIVVDGLRSAIYAPATAAPAEISYFGMMRRALLDRAARRGYAVLDLQAAFRTAFDKDHRRFDFADDYHWNGHGHEVVADAIRHTDWYRRVVPRK